MTRIKSKLTRPIQVICIVILSVMAANAARAQDLEDSAMLKEMQVAALSKVKKSKAPAKRFVTKPRPAVSPRASGKVDPNFARAKAYAANGQYQEASRLLFQMSRSFQYRSDWAQIKYILGLTLFQMKLNQSAAFVFYDLIHQESRENPKSRYLKQALEKIAIAADALDSDVLLRFAIKQVDEKEFPSANRDMLAYRTGEVKLEEKDYRAAAQQFARIRSDSQFFLRARYKLAMSLTEAGLLEQAQAGFEDLIERTKNAGVTDNMNVSAKLGRARVMYQRHQFSDAIEAYREIPRDTEQWHESLFESTWAMLRDGRFRSALSNFHTLHSPFYEDVYQPESLLLRSIVYLYICRHEEMEKTLNLFQAQYRPVSRSLELMLTTVNDPITYFREILKTRDNFDALRENRVGRRGFMIPFLVAREVLSEGDVRRSFNYLENLDAERKLIISLPSSWKNSGIGMYAKKIVERRIDATRVLGGKQVRHHLVAIQSELRDLFEQDGFLRFEMISGKKEVVRKELQGKGLKRNATHVDEDTEREFYVQNGYDYWPFRGEYWLDEIGNYHYVGVKACE
jgi:tetratricopeptide (TPR) repeat protein